MEGKRSEMFYVFGESIRSCALGTHAGYYHQHFKWHNDMNLPYASSRESTVNLPLEIQSGAAGPSSRQALSFCEPAHTTGFANLPLQRSCFLYGHSYKLINSSLQTGNSFLRPLPSMHN